MSQAWLFVGYVLAMLMELDLADLTSVKADYTQPKNVPAIKQAIAVKS